MLNNSGSAITNEKNVFMEKPLTDDILNKHKSSYVNIENSYPLTPLQLGMLFHYLSDKSSGTDIDQMVCKLNEPVDLLSLQKAWNNVIANYDVCKTFFRWENVDNPIQVISEEYSININVHNWGNTPEKELRQNLISFLKSDRSNGIDLSRAPLMRLNLIKLTSEQYYLIWTFHHIILDGRSHAIILNEVFSLYDSYLSGSQYQLTKSVPYKNFVTWNLKQDHTRSKEFWKDLLKGISSPTEVRSFYQANNENLVPDLNEDEIIIDEDTSKLLKSFAKFNDITLNTIVQAGWALLLSKYSSEEDVLFGAVRAGRYSTVDNADSIPGLFMNTLPIRIKIDYEKKIIEWLKEIRNKQIKIREYEHTPLVDIVSWSEIPRSTKLFQSVLIFDNYDLTSKFQERGGKWLNREFTLFEKTGYPLTVYVYADKKIKIKIVFDDHIFSGKDIEVMLNHFRNLLIGILKYSDYNAYQIPFLTESEIHKIFSEWNNTGVEYNKNICIHHAFERQVTKSPDNIAVYCNGKELTYKQLNQRANKLARSLVNLGVNSESLIGIHLRRSVDMMVAILGILKAGCAYVPLDPEFPVERISFMIEDSNCALIITQSELAENVSKTCRKTLLIDTDWEKIENESEDNLYTDIISENLAYVIYTSGSTGKPKGVMVQHNNVQNFFVGMDQHIGFNSPGTWLAVTSLSFDISVLELLWTLCRGFKVVIYAEEDLNSIDTKTYQDKLKKKIEFSLFYFSSYAGENQDEKYRLLLEGAKFADQNRFSAVWTPERHFHDFGGLYPNPAITSAAIAAITKHVRIMSGSVVSPLHSSIRIAEDWSVVDNLSNGRVGISFASGWQPNDFAIMPGNYERRKDIMFEQIEVVRKLWKGEPVEFKSPLGKNILLRTLPRPIQKELPVWITAASNPETFRMAGERGFNILTHLLGQSIEDLEEKINIYRKAWKENGHGPGNGHVSLMLHTFIGENIDEVKETVREPMKHYLKSAMSLVQMAEWYFPVYKSGTADISKEAVNLTEEDKNAILNHSFERYFETSALLGTPESCLETINKIKKVGVDEVACLIDFGVASEKVLDHLQYLNAVKTLANLGIKDEKEFKHSENLSIPELINKFKVTHFQCTPSMARMLLLDNKSKSSLENLDYILIGGETFPAGLAKELSGIVKGKILNMYGPTETTIWSTVHHLNGIEENIPIGKPIANTQIFILDKNQQLNPIGVAGELCIGGDGVVRGYFARPDLTAEKFILFDNNEIKKRIYRTGDLVRYREDGVVEFLGRLDFQVKIRGYRIELGEIETILEKHPQVRQAVVIARDSADDKILVAYLVVTKNSNLSNAVLRSYLLEKLPDYMVPSVFMFLQKMPTTPNGKIDRKALPVPDTDRPDIGKDFILPQTPTDKRLAEIWSQILNIDSIGLNDSFFELGGHSLSAVQAVIRIQQEFGVDLSMLSFFQTSTLKELAAAIDEKLKSKY